ncbi:MAG: response regulator [Nitrospirae bacterium]|nr:response regulator [Nitrospirota bacterium]
MRVSLQIKVSIFIALIIILISAVSTYLFTTAHTRSKEQGRILRGTALSYSLSKAAEEGLINEDLDLIKKASYIIKSPDVTLAQVYSDIWEAVDAYPFERLKDPPSPEAVMHFKGESSPFQVKISDGYDFYSPIFFRTSEDAPPVIIGFVRIILSSAAIQKELRGIIITNIVVSAIITLLAIISINILIGRLVIKPVMSLHRAASQFKDGIMPDMLPQRSADEIGELSLEFNRMSHAIKDRTDKLIESEKKIKSIFERVEHAIFRLGKDGSVIEANSRFKEMFGEVTGLCDILIGEKTAPDCLRKALTEKGFHLEDMAIGKTGDEIIISLSLYPETDSSGSITGFDGYLINITEKKRMEERLIRAQKMEAVGTLAGGMAHDFNNLLTAILGYAEIILSMTQEGDPFHKPATIIHDAAKRGADFGKKILTISRKEKMEAKSVDINDIVKNSLELLRRSIPKNIEIATNLKEGIPYTKADSSQLQQVIINLAVNARDAMPDGGRLLIETATVGIENGAPGNIRAGKSGFIKLSVSDTGAGIDRVTQRKIFDPFFTTKEIGKGTGLGLYIVHSIINNHGGYINLYSEALKGTQFNIYLPVTKETDIEEAPQDTQDIRGSGLILVIDDESDVRELCRDMLEPLGYTVLLAESGSAGINIFRQMQDKIAIVIMDMIMPKMGGTEVFRALKTIAPGVKVLLCSGYSQNGFAGIDELLKQGAIGSIQKPFSRREIATAIKKALSG